MTATSGAAEKAAEKTVEAGAVAPNLFTFTGRQDDTQVVFSTTSVTGKASSATTTRPATTRPTAMRSPSRADRSAHSSPSPSNHPRPAHPHRDPDSPGPGRPPDQRLDGLDGHRPSALTFDDLEPAQPLAGDPMHGRAPASPNAPAACPSTTATITSSASGHALDTAPRTAVNKAIRFRGTGDAAARSPS